VIDAGTNDEVWRVVLRITQFASSSRRKTATRVSPRKAKVAYDARNLYVLSSARSTHPTAILKAARARDVRRRHRSAQDHDRFVSRPAQRLSSLP